MKTILLFRHFESLKNTENKFSSDDNQEALTPNSIDIIKKYSFFFESIINENNIQKIYCADSKRAIDSARLISKNIVQIEPFKEFNSIIYNAKGVSESEAETTNPDFINGLYLYRKGLYSSYSIPTPKESENLTDFEDRVWNTFLSIVEKDNSNLLLFFLHRSPITSILINFARKYYNYPNDFFGYVELDLGYFSLLRLGDNIGEIKAINQNIDELEKLHTTRYCQKRG